MGSLAALAEAVNKGNPPYGSHGRGVEVRPKVGRGETGDVRYRNYFTLPYVRYLK